ncbi:SAM-dependent methyltransferase [Weissella diestrammenae]|uniref:SAM-dependent methyltransferase n=1 Tax=Weissella diestrammenae TaxID=1162633 RepID=A0A7G9T6W6_9LACO|nr:SAM-dependent methyltransferase [Weissella diestrammenae]MCM0582565.1 SAM-dependent methyltransferase [Weissella diestrammenae]QNN75841.1 SAM-dependent methyltransferase [Weissella diestrammenae]
MKNQQIHVGEEQLIEEEYLNELLHYQAQFKMVPKISQLIEMVIDAISALKMGNLPPRLPVLEIDEAMIADLQQSVLARYPNQPELGNAFWQTQINALSELDFLFRHFRDFIIEQFSMYGYISAPWIQALSKYLNGRTTLELMAGRGYLTAGLRACNQDQLIVAIDNATWINQPDVRHQSEITAVEHLDVQLALEKYGAQSEVIIMSWAPDTSEIDVAVLEWIRMHFKGELIVIGELEGATNSKKFWQTAQITPIKSLNDRYPSFDLIDEKTYHVE